VRVSIRLEEGLGAVDADRGQIEQALLNICLNAWQAMPGGGTVDIATRRAAVDAAKAASFGAAPGEFAVITVADTGTGIDRSVLSRIFDPFFSTREPGAGPRGRSGSGLGLSSAYGILRNHGGFIEVDSERGKGSTFSLWLPRSAAEVPESREADAGDAAAEAGRLTVMVVEDEPMVAEVAALMLQRLGLNVIKALSGESAVAHFRERGGRVDLVLLDMIMPGMGGDETFRRMREIDPGAKVLLSSGYSREGRAQDLIKAGCLGFLQKPYNLAELRAKLEEILGPLVSAPNPGDA
jgi:two-component system cell cycle sensor histidine kinase/response regulator CckA